MKRVVSFSKYSFQPLYLNFISDRETVYLFLLYLFSTRFTLHL